MRGIAYDWGEYGEYEQYIALLCGDNSKSHGRLIANLTCAIAEELTERQREMLRMYYLEGKSAHVIAEEKGVCISTVSRTLKRAKNRLRRCLRFGAVELLASNTQLHSG